MKNILILCGVLCTLLLATDVNGQCQTCIARHCADGGPRLVCEEFPPPGHGCVSSGYCPVLSGGCVKGKLTQMIARVEVDPTPTIMMLNVRYTFARTLLALGSTAIPPQYE
jgi:hypothetical protein